MKAAGRMNKKSSTSVFTRAYNLARAAKLLEIPGFKRVFLFSYFLYKRWYEDPFWALSQRCPELFAAGDILDIGANIGYTARVFASAINKRANAKTQPPAKVYAFEPDLASFGTLEEIVRRKKLGDAVEIFNLAVGSADGSLAFWHNEEHSADHRVATEQFKSARPAGEKITKVAVTSVDSLVAARHLQSISFIKIDVQGYELAVCEGMRGTLEKFPAVCIAFEYAPTSMRELGFEPSALLDFFRSAGYQLHILTRAATTLAPDNRAIELAAERSGYVDVLCSKNILSRN
ncbi:MAG: FkbM family methyltransferase [Candidatus Acidiferrales bacterium]